MLGRKKSDAPAKAEWTPARQRRQRALFVVGAAWMLLSYCGVEVYCSRYLGGGSTSIHTFGLCWAILLTGVSLALPRWIGKVVYGLSFYFFAIFGAVQCCYYSIFGRMMWLGDVRYAGEGGAFVGDVLGQFSRGWWCATILLMVIGCIGCFLVPRGARRGRLRVVCLLAALSAAVGLYAYPGVVFRQDDAQGVWGAQNEYRRAMSAEGVYTTMYDAHKVYQICGIFQTTVKDAWTHQVYPKTPMYRRQVERRAAEIDSWFDERPAHEDNGMTGIFEGKNVVLVLMESMDDWLINSSDTPTISRLMDEGINFTNFYTPGYGSVRTFNSEFCVNTGIFLPTNGQYAFDYCNNDFSESMASLLRAQNYSAEAFHYNDVTFYNRGVMEPAMGYENYNSYMNYGIVGDALLSDTAVFSNEDLMAKFYGGEEGDTASNFLSFIITRSAHMTYTYNEELSRFALGQYPRYMGASGHEEVDCIRAKARCCDAMFARLLRSLEENGHLEDTVIVAFTDHYAYGMQDKQELLRRSGVDDMLLVEKTPCFIWSYGGPSMEVDKTLNTSDLLPTVVNLFGLDSSYRYLGQDAFDENYEGYAIFQDRSWITKDGAYQDGSVLDTFGTEGPSAEEIASMNDLAQTYIHINNLLLESDYYGRAEAEK